MKLSNINIVQKYKIWFVIPFIIILVAAACFTGFAVVNKDINKGVNVGIDFAGGTVITLTLGEKNLVGENYTKNLNKAIEIIKSPSIAEEVLNFAKEQKDADGNAVYPNINLTNLDVHVNNPQLSGKGEEMSLIIKIDNISTTFDANNALTSHRKGIIENQLAEYFSDANGFGSPEISTSMIGATASANLIKTAVLSVVITLVLILIYIIIRFELWSGLAAIIALAHDVIMMFALTVICRVQINSAFIAAMISIVAYSINNTIVVFDRVRENHKMEKGLVAGNFVDNNAVVNKALVETLLRSINSTVTTLIAIVLFAILGSTAVREFALPVIFGLVAGFFSSLCIAPSLYCLMKNASDNAKKNKLAKNNSSKKFAGV